MVFACCDVFVTNAVMLDQEDPADDEKADMLAVVTVVMLM